MGKFADELIQGMMQALEHAQGRRVDGMRVSDIYPAGGPMGEAPGTPQGPRISPGEDAIPKPSPRRR